MWFAGECDAIHKRIWILTLAAIRRGKGETQYLFNGAGEPTTGAKQEYRVMTVALIRDPKQAEAVEVAFSESARFYRLLRANPEFERILAALREAKEKKQPVRVLMESPQSNVIMDVKTSG